VNLPASAGQWFSACSFPAKHVSLNILDCPRTRFIELRCRGRQAHAYLAVPAKGLPKFYYNLKLASGRSLSWHASAEFGICGSPLKVRKKRR